MLLDVESAIAGDTLPSFDTRSPAELSDAVLGDPDPVERERALWELGHRRNGAISRFLQTVLQSDPDPSLRANALALALRAAPDDAPELLRAALRDAHPEVRDWARLHLRRLTGAELPHEYTGVAYTEESPFDQIMPLQSAGFALLHVPAVGWLRVTLSPRWFDQVMGRTVACMRIDTVLRELTVEACLVDYHDDGSSHYELYPFRGVSWPSANRLQHRYESTSVRKFYPSGKIDDRSQGVHTAPVVLHRIAETASVAVKALPSLVAAGTVTDVRRRRLLIGNVTRSIDGRFFGFAHTSIEQFVRHGKVLPGTVQLVSPADPAVAPFVNTYLCGTFWGKLTDDDGDGKIDLNTIPYCGAGDVDYNDIAWPPDFPA